MAVILYIQLVAHLFKQNRYGTASIRVTRSSTYYVIDSMGDYLISYTNIRPNSIYYIRYAQSAYPQEELILIVQPFNNQVLYFRWHGVAPVKPMYNSSPT